MYKVFLRKSAERKFSKLPKDIQKEIVGKLELLRENPFWLTNVKKVLGFKNGYRFRLGRWRIFYLIREESKDIEVIDIFMKKGDEDYARLRRFI